MFKFVNVLFGPLQSKIYPSFSGKARNIGGGGPVDRSKVRLNQHQTNGSSPTSPTPPTLERRTKLAMKPVQKQPTANKNMSEPAPGAKSSGYKHYYDPNKLYKPTPNLAVTTVNSKHKAGPQEDEEDGNDIYEDDVDRAEDTEDELNYEEGTGDELDYEEGAEDDLDFEEETKDKEPEYYYYYYYDTLDSGIDISHELGNIEPLPTPVWQVSANSSLQSELLKQ